MCLCVFFPGKDGSEEPEVEAVVEEVPEAPRPETHRGELNGTLATGEGWKYSGSIVGQYVIFTNTITPSTSFARVRVCTIACTFAFGPRTHASMKWPHRNSRLYTY